MKLFYAGIKKVCELIFCRFSDIWAFSKKWTHRTAKLYEATGGVPPWENGLAIDSYTQECYPIFLNRLCHHLVIRTATSLRIG